jgi:hypothetical protein
MVLIQENYIIYSVVLIFDPLIFTGKDNIYGGFYKKILHFYILLPNVKQKLTGNRSSKYKA